MVIEAPPAPALQPSPPKPPERPAPTWVPIRPLAARHRDRILAHAGAQDLERRHTALGVFRAVDCRGPSFTNMLEKAVPGHGASDEVLLCHWVGKVLAPVGPSKTGPT